MNNLQLASLFLTKPSQGFVALKESPRFLLPMLLVLTASLGPIAWYFAQVDMDWMRAQMAAQAGVPEGQPGAMVLSRNALLWSTIIFGGLATVALSVVGAVYFLLVTKVAGMTLTFRHWFAFNWWASTPLVIAAIAMVLVLAFDDTRQMSLNDVQPLSLNELIFHRTADQPGYQLLTSISLLHIVVWWFTVLGVRIWSGRSLLFSAIVGLLPSVLLYGIWALIAFR